MKPPRDVLRYVAGFLAAVGTLWAIFSLLWIIIILASPGGLVTGLFGLAGYGVWFGWIWRTLETPPLKPALWMWAASLLVNGYFMKEGFGNGWCALAAGLSVAAMVIEPFIARVRPFR